MDFNVIFNEDCLAGLKKLPDGIVHTCVTSPPYYGLRDYGVEGQIGLEETPDAYVARLVEVFREVRRVLRDDGTLWLNIGDSYAGYHGNKNATYEDAPSNKGGYFENQRKTLVNHNGIKNKDLIGIPWRVAFALQADGWYLRQDIIWHKPNPMPESVTDRCTKAHEYIFLLAKSERYYYDAEAIKEPCVSLDPNHSSYRPNSVEIAKNGRKESHAKHEMSARNYSEDGRNRRSVWTVTTKPFAEAHFATFPPELITPCILAGAPADGVVLDPFMGSGTVAATALEYGRRYLGFELNPEYIKIAERRIKPVAIQPLLLV